ncbi:putative capsular polysaccharide biosynthesis protein YwqC [subsurface metagenome]
MQLRQYIRILTRRGWIIIVAVFVTTAAALVFSLVQAPVYRSTIFLNVWPARLDWGLQQTIKGLMRNYALTIGSRQTATEVVNRLQLDITPDQMREKLTVDPIEEDFLIRIDADDYDPFIARDIAQTAAEVFVERIDIHMLDQDKRERLDINIRDYASWTLHRPKPKINALAGAVFGVIIGGLIVFLLEWLEADIIRSPEDMERHTGVAVLATICTGSARSSRSARRQAHPTGGIVRGR